MGYPWTIYITRKSGEVETYQAYANPEGYLQKAFLTPGPKGFKSGFAVTNCKERKVVAEIGEV